MNTIESFIAETELSQYFKNFKKDIVEQFPQLSVEEGFLIWHYTASGYVRLNEGLRNGSKDQYILEYESYLNQALSKLPPFIGLSYRGEPMSAERLNNYESYFKNGEDITMLCFYSSTNIRRIAEKEFANRNSDNKVVFRINGKEGRKIEKLAHILLDNEKEILFKSKTTFSITNIGKEGKYIYIDLIEM